MVDSLFLGISDLNFSVGVLRLSFDLLWFEILIDVAGYFRYKNKDYDVFRNTIS